jgi:restriction endonuclease Mrr
VAEPPDDLIEDGYGQLRAALVFVLRERIAAMPRAGFEQLVVDLLTTKRFAGVLQGQPARKGVFITSSSFTKEAESYARSIQTAIVLMDGAQSAELMIGHGVGVTPVRRYEIKRVDSDYFAAE